jgi:hypothetical protein
MEKNYAEMNPIEEIGAIREEIMEEFKTLDAYVAYLQTLPSASELLAQKQDKNKNTDPET